MDNTNEILPVDPLVKSDIYEIGKQLREGSLTCVELTSIYYRRINFLNPNSRKKLLFIEDIYRNIEIKITKPFPKIHS